jgi:magnesium transporter
MSNKPVQLYQYDSEIYSLESNDEAHFANVFDPTADSNKIHWLNYHSLHNKEAIQQLCTRFNIDHTLQELLFTRSTRVRIEEYTDFVYFSIVSALPSVQLNVYHGLYKEQLSFVLGENFLISFQEKSSDHFPSVRTRITQKRGRVRFKKAGYLLYLMMDAILDNYSEVVEASTNRIQVLDGLIQKTPKNELLKEVELEKRKLIELRKIVSPMRELMQQLERLDARYIEADDVKYFNGLKDTCSSLIDEIDAHKQMLEGISNLFFAVQNQRLSETMKLLTVISAIFIPLTFIVGVYGMNFDIMPELRWKYGYFIIWGIMIVLTVVLIVVFWKRGWLKQNKLNK